jgi:hypothetical protein
VRALLRRVRAFVHEYTGIEAEAAGRGMETATAEESDVTLADSAESVTYPCVPLFFDGRLALGSSSSVGSLGFFLINGAGAARAKTVMWGESGQHESTAAAALNGCCTAHHCEALAACARVCRS